MSVSAVPNPVRRILDGLPRRQLFEGPSPIVRLSRLERALNTRVALFLKREDLLRPLFGNKIRYLEYVLGLYDQEQADCLVHAGGLSSNYMTQVALLGATEGIPVHLILDGVKPDVLPGNPLLQELCGAVIYYREKDEPTNQHSKKWLAEQLRRQGRRPYVIDYPQSNFTAYCGYMRCYLEICDQEAAGPKFERIYLCSGWHSYLGLRLAADLMGHDRNIKAFRPAYWRDSGLQTLYPDFTRFLIEKTAEFAQYLETDLPVKDFDVSEEFTGDGYGKTDARTLEAMRLLASLEGILLDPIYSGKAFAGFLKALPQAEAEGCRSVLFIHTGGFVNIFNHNKEITDYLDSTQRQEETHE